MKFYGGGGSRGRGGGGNRGRGGSGRGGSDGPSRGGRGGGGRGGGFSDRGGRGRGGSSGGGRGSGGRGGLAKTGGHDARFAGRFSDPAFKLRANKGDLGTGMFQRGGGRGGRGGRGRGGNNNNNKSNFNGRRSEEEEDNDEHERSDEEDEEEISNMSGSDEEEEHSGEEGEELEYDEAPHIDDDVAAFGEEQANVTMTEATRRIAIVNCDWDHVRAMDIFAILSYAVPIGGRLVKVTQHMSNFGREQMERERTHGPDLWLKPNEKVEEEEEEKEEEEPPMKVVSEEPGTDQEDSEAGDDDESDGWVEDNAAMLDEEGEDGERFSKGKYRRYEMNRMKYFYCVAEFDSADTAAAIYDELDGIDIESSGVTLDLRYIEDSVTFDDNPPIATVTKLPTNFKPLSSFKSSALSQTKFALSWDQNDVFRTQSIRDVFTKDSAEDDLAAYMGSSDSEDDEDKEAHRAAIRKKYSKLLEEIGGLDDDADGGKKKKKNANTKKDEDDDEVEEAEDEEEEGSEYDSDDDDEKYAGAFATDSDGEGDDGEEDEEDFDDDESNDDDLNRFSDVDEDEEDDEEGEELEDEEGEEGEEGEEDDDASSVNGSINGDMSATFDIDAETKAQQLAKEAKLRKELAKADLGQRAQLLHKIKRKESKKAKKEMLKEEREAERAALALQEKERKAKLRAALGSAVESEKELISGKEKRKAHAKLTKERVANERQDKKLARIAHTLGGGAAVRAAVNSNLISAVKTPATAAAVTAPAAPAAASGVDSRFAAKLAHDPRFHLDVSTKSGKKDAELVKLATNVARTRQREREEADANSRNKKTRVEQNTGSKKSSTSAADDDEAVNFFLNKKK